jgi:hypothetical protein
MNCIRESTFLELISFALVVHSERGCNLNQVTQPLSDEYCYSETSPWRPRTNLPKSGVLFWWSLNRWRMGGEFGQYGAVKTSSYVLYNDCIA